MKTKLLSLIISLFACSLLVAQEQPIQKVDVNGVYLIPDKMPEYPGGVPAMMKFLSSNVKYPVEAQKAGTQGRVILSFIVNKDGSISNVEVIRSVSKELDAEAVRVVQSMPKWKPAMSGGKAVRFEKTLPITFKYTPQETVLTFEEYLKNLEEERVMLEKGEKMNLEDMARRVNAFKEQLGDDATLRKMLLEKSQSIKGQIDSTVKAQTKVLKLKKNDVKELTKIYEDEIDAKIKLIESLGTDQFISYFVESELEMRKIEMDKMLKIKDLLKDRFKLYFENYILQQ